MTALRRTAFAAVATLSAFPMVYGQTPPDEAPAAFDNVSNGFVDQAAFDEARDIFEEREGLADGLGPVYNAQSCAECHQTPVTGGVSQVTELRAGHNDSVGHFTPHRGGSLINDRAIDVAFQEHILPGNETVAFRSSLNILGDGFIEAIPDSAILAVRTSQPSNMRGEAVTAPILEAPNVTRVGRFGHKSQHASLLSFAADAYLNEMGITSPLQATENTSNGTVVDDGVADPEDDGEDIEFFATFMRSTKVPPRDLARAGTTAAVNGSNTFNSIGCAVCHVRNFTTAPAGTVLNGGTFTVPPALGNKVIHPFSDFLLHDIATGDGIVQSNGDSTGPKIRTAVLWGLRTKSRFMHDTLSPTLTDAILRHQFEAQSAIDRFKALSTTRKNELLAFLGTL